MSLINAGEHAIANGPALPIACLNGFRDLLVETLEDAIEILTRSPRLEIENALDVFVEPRLELGRIDLGRKTEVPRQWG
jgi:hypothetical protein